MRSICGPSTSFRTTSNSASAAINLGKRYADYAQAAVLPSYVIVDAMAAWTVDRRLTLRVNVK